VPHFSFWKAFIKCPSLTVSGSFDDVRYDSTVANFSNLLVHWIISMVHGKNYETMSKFVKVMPRMCRIFFPHMVYTCYIITSFILCVHANSSCTMHISLVKYRQMTYFVVGVCCSTFTSCHSCRTSYVKSCYYGTILVKLTVPSVLWRCCLLTGRASRIKKSRMIEWLIDPTKKSLLQNTLWCTVLWDITKQLVTDIISHYWKLFPRSLGRSSSNYL